VSAYKFVTHWEVPAPLPVVWEEISHPERWPTWWRAVESVTELKRGDDLGVGALRRYVWRGALPYRLRFDMLTTDVEKYSRLVGTATGELDGRGCWTFAPDGNGTALRYDWEVDTTKWWMRALAPIARSLFEWNHDVVMRQGLEGLLLLVAQRDERIDPRRASGR